VAGGAGYGLYTHTDLFGCKGSHECCLLAKKSCCEEAATPKLTCCQQGSECCDVGAECCATGTAVLAGVTGEKTEACCAAKAKLVAAKAGCCPACPECCVACCGDCCGEVCCSLCPACCGACCGNSAKVAVAGPAAVLAGSPKK